MNWFALLWVFISTVLTSIIAGALLHDFRRFDVKWNTVDGRWGIALLILAISGWAILVTHFTGIPKITITIG